MTHRPHDPPLSPPGSLLGAPVLRPQPYPVPVGPVPVGPTPRMVLPRVVPTLTVYADGHCNLNGEASALLSKLAAGLCFRRPVPVRAGRLPRPWEVEAGECEKLVGRTDKPGQLRCWPAPEDCPPPGRYLLTPIAGRSRRFTLVPG